MLSPNEILNIYNQAAKSVGELEWQPHFLTYAAKQNQEKLSQAFKNSLLDNNSKPPSQTNFETDGFIVKNELYQLRSLSILITSFIAIFQSYEFLNEEDHDHNFTVLEKLFTGQSLEGINRIKWYDQSRDLRKTGNNTWKQLYYIFYQLYFFEIISFNTTPGVQKSISYRLLNAFCSVIRPEISKYSEVDDNPLGKYLFPFKTKDSRGFLVIEPPSRQHPGFELAVKSLIATYGGALKSKNS